MRILVGETRSSRDLSVLQRNDWGRMFVVARPTPFPSERWGFDNGAFVAWTQGLPFPEEDFISRLDDAQYVGSDPCLAVCPDIVAGGLRSLDFSMKWLPRLTKGWPWYLAVQDGMTTEDVKPVLHMFSGLFLGGSDRFKATAYRWARLAHLGGKKFHYGRAGTPAKIRHAIKVKADSLDSAFPLWTTERMLIFERAIRNYSTAVFTCERLGTIARTAS